MHPFLLFLFIGRKLTFILRHIFVLGIDAVFWRSGACFEFDGTVLNIGSQHLEKDDHEAKDGDAGGCLIKDYDP